MAPPKKKLSMCYNEIGNIEGICILVLGKRSKMKFIIVCFLACSIVGSAAGQEYLPLETGNFWSYVADDGAKEMRVVGDQVPVFQGNPYGIEYTISPNNQGLVNYWTSGPDGDVLLWGFFREGWGYLYQPPILMVDAPLSVSKTWTTTTDMYTLPGTIFEQTADFAFMVREAPELTVPAGVFPTYGIGFPDPGAKTFLNGRYTLWGELRTDKDAGVDSWYSLDVGIVQDNLDRFYKLETYTDHPVAVVASTWGSVKALYRGTD